MNEQQKLQQIRLEYNEGANFLYQTKIRWVEQLQLLSNINRGKDKVSSTLLWSFFHRVHSNIYSNDMAVEFVAGSDDEMANAEHLNKLAKNDAQEMSLDVINYDKLWDALAFSRGYVETIRFNKKRKILEPVVINPLMLCYDPYYSDIQQWRYYSKWVLKSSYEIERLVKQDVITGIRSSKDIVSGAEGQIWDYKVRREQARNVNTPGTDSASPNGIYQILEHFTVVDGDKYVFWTDRDITKILREEKLEFDDDDDGSKWPIVATDIFREPHSTKGVSVFDLIEDKHRALNVLYNLAFIAAKDSATPLYQYIPEKIVNPAQLFQRQIMQHIPVSEMNAVAPIAKAPALTSDVMQFSNILKSETAEAIGTSQLSQMVRPGKKTATEAAVLQQIADLTGSLQSKIIAMGEKEFWSHWYQRYIKNTKSGDVKMLTISHAGTHAFENIDLGDIKTKLPPRIIISTPKEAEYKEMVERRELAQQFGIFQQTIPADKFTLFLKKIYLPKFKTLDIETIDTIFPKSLEEIRAEQENDLLNKDKFTPVADSDDHATHLYVHMQGKRNVQMNAHILTHEVALAQKNKQQAQQSQPADGNPPKTKDINPDEAIAPVKQNAEKIGKDSKLGV